MRLRSHFIVADDDGQAMVEYALIICLVVLVLIVLLILMGNQVLNLYCNVSGNFHN